MFIIETYFTAVIFCVVTMLCWGSWPNTQKLAGSSWPFELFYWDYVIGIVLFTLVLALTLGSMGDQGRPFIEDFRQGSSDNILSAFIGGVIFNFANILLTAAIAVAGMSVAFPVGIGLALIIGVIVNYYQQPAGNASLLGVGVILVAAAIILNALAYRRQLKMNATPSVKGLGLSIVAGCLMGLFYKYVAASMSIDFSSPEPYKLTPYTALVIFSIGVLISNFVFNTILVYFPITRKKVEFSQYLNVSFRTHGFGILGGFIWALGMSASILAAEKAGPAISYGLGQGATLVAAIWGIYVWKEFDRSQRSINLMLKGMLLLYFLGLVTIIASRHAIH